MKELEKNELMEVEGGFAWLPIIGLVLAVVAATSYVVDNWDRAQEGWADGKAAANQ
jgi:lactobin A/cerein 7B family class IIb bacteriocin